MARRMIDPQTIIKSQVVDDKYSVDLYEILEKYGTEHDGAKTITLQIYNKLASDEPQNYLYNNNIHIGNVITNGSITISKMSNNIYIQGGLLDSSDYVSNIYYLNLQSGSYENGFILSNIYKFDVHVVKV